MWRVPSITSIGAVAGLAAGAGAFWMFGGPGFGSGAPVPESRIAAEVPPDVAGGSPPATPPAPSEAARPEPAPAEPAAANANEEVWRRLALGDREGVLRILQTPGAGRGIAPDGALASNVLKAVRGSVLQARRTAGAASGPVSLEPYRSAEEQLARANQLEANGRPTEALGALWEAADLYAESIALGSRQPSPVAAEPQVSVPAAPAGEPDRVAQPAPPPAAASTPSEPAKPPATEPASSGLAASPVADAPKAPSDSDAILDALRRYQAAYEALDVSRLQQVFPSLAPDQVEQLQRTFLGMATYEIQVRNARVDVQGDVAIVHGLVSRRMVPRVGGRPVTNDSRHRVSPEARKRRLGDNRRYRAVIRSSA